jgi:prepilin-type processing-associated H-X9-DG protein
LYNAGGPPDHNERAFKLEGLTAYDHYGTSYAASTLHASWGQSGSRVVSMSLYFTPLSRIADPAHTLAYREIPSRFPWFWGLDERPGGECSAPVSGSHAVIPGWHGSPFHFNAAFADGHAATIEMQGTFRPAPNLGNLTYPPNPCEAQEPYECFRCATVRGPGWQLDSLPAEPALTPWYAGVARAGRFEVMLP